MPSKILIVDDFPIIRAGLKALLSTAPELKIIGEAENGKLAVLQARQLKPDLVLMDLTMPVMNGTEAIRMIKQANPKIKILALTDQQSLNMVKTAMAAGANGYILKEDAATYLFSAISSVLKGQVYLRSGVSDRLVSGFTVNYASFDSESIRLNQTRSFQLDD